MTCTGGIRDDAIAATFTSTPAADGLLDLNSITSDGFTAIVDLQGPVNITVFWEAWGGDITVAKTIEISEPSATGNQSYTVTGLTSDGNQQVVMFAGGQVTGTTPTAERQHCANMIGAATSSTKQWVLYADNDDNNANSVTARYGTNQQCIAMATAANNTTGTNAKAAFSSWDTNGFTLNWTARGTTGRKYIALAIKGGLWTADELTLDVGATNATTTVSGLAYAPIGLSFCGMWNSENTTAEVAAGVFALGTGTSTTSRRSMYAQAADSQANSTIWLAIEYDQLLSYYDGTSTIATIDINAMNSDGFQVITDLGAGGNIVQWFGYLTFGNPPAITGTLTATLGAISLSAAGSVDSTAALSGGGASGRGRYHRYSFGG